MNGAPSMLCQVCCASPKRPARLSRAFWFRN